MEVYQLSDIGEFDQQVRELEATITRINLRNNKIEQALKVQLTSLAAADVKCDAKIALLKQQSAQDIRPQVDRLQMTMLQELDAYDRLHEQVSVFHHRSVPLEETVTTLMRRIGEVVNQQGTGNVPPQVLPMPDWSIGGPSDLGI
jgi:predicted  nucleic acid-binding Zn-ribbon protein